MSRIDESVDRKYSIIIKSFITSFMKLWPLTSVLVKNNVKKHFLVRNRVCASVPFWNSPSASSSFPHRASYLFKFLFRVLGDPPESFKVFKHRRQVRLVKCHRNSEHHRNQTNQSRGTYCSSNRSTFFNWHAGFVVFVFAPFHQIWFFIFLGGGHFFYLFFFCPRHFSGAMLGRFGTSVVKSGVWSYFCCFFRPAGGSVSSDTRPRLLYCKSCKAGRVR